MHTLRAICLSKLLSILFCESIFIELFCLLILIFVDLFILNLLKLIKSIQSYLNYSDLFVFI